MKVLIHLFDGQGVVGVWRVDSEGKRDSYYRDFPGKDRLQSEASSYLDQKGADPTWQEWLEDEMAYHSPHTGSYYATLESPVAEPLPAVFQRAKIGNRNFA